MGKTQTIFVCTECGYQSVKWLGKCPHCASWETFEEQTETKHVMLSDTGMVSRNPSTPVPLAEVSRYSLERIPTGLAGFDTILGGGLVKGEVVLIGGEPGVGKSTLLLEVSAKLAQKGKVLYVSAEESVEQVALRAKRLGLHAENFYLLNEEDISAVYEHIKKERFEFLIVDSIQVVHHPSIGTQKGSVPQIKGCADFLTQIAKNTGLMVFIVGHVTKDGMIAGPKLLEHIVDCVLYFESEVISYYRILRTIKNRFGATGEIAAFQMTEDGLNEVESLSGILLPHHQSPVAGSSIVCVVEGIRPLVLELQSLVSKASFGVVRRRSLGFDFNRFSLLIAIIEKRLKLTCSSDDVFLNVSGGLRINDPSADLAACMAIISSYKDKAILEGIVFLGEVGLAGEIRPLNNINIRLKEIARSGFKKVFIPQGNLKEVDVKVREVTIKAVNTLKETVEEIW
ncbi:MAG: DNA repair protein RadA [Candidatus Omnitrophica bacterium]|nr:DNA repair protein RadA [Candidatus Omnitrophota bacterium]